MSKQKSEDQFELSLPIPEGWKPGLFASIVDKISTNKKKIKESDYLGEGRYPVVDQGQTLISGYSNNKECLIEVDGTVVVFGDHTRIVKQISTSFVPGADGIKVLKAKENIEPRFLFWLTYYLSQLLPSKGYARHYQYIDDSKIASPNFDVQKKIANKIDLLFSEIDAGIQELQNAKQKLELYKQSILNSAVQGKLVPQDTKDEPASKLMERIRAEKEKLIKEKTLKKEKQLPPIDLSEVPFELPKGWEWVRIGELLHHIEAGKSFKCDERRPQGTQIGVVKVSSVTWGEYDENESKTCTDSKMINEDFFIAEGDFLFSRANTIELVGAAVIAGLVTRKNMLSDKILRLIFIENKLNEWILLNLRTQYGRQQIQDYSSGNQDSMRNIGQDGIRKIIVPIPPLSAVKKIIDMYQKYNDTTKSQATEFEKTYQVVSILKQSVLKSAFEGKLI